MDLNLLNQAFGRFNEAVDVLSGYYDSLSREIASLNLELEEKNKALSASLAENERSKQFLTQILDNLATGVVVIDPENEVTLANRAALNLMGLSNFDNSGYDLKRPLEQSFGLTDPCSWQEVRNRLEENGRHTVFFSSSEDRLLASGFSPFHWPDSREQGIIALIDDVTDHARIGLQRERSQTLSAMGEMASEIAHQFRNPLGGIELIASILGREVAGDGNKERLVEQILSGVKQVNHLITNYLDLAGNPNPILESVDLAELVLETVNAVSPALETQEAEIRVNTPEQASLAQVDRELIGQVLTNIIYNAIEALDFGGVISIDFSSDSRGVEVSIEDNGRGIPKEDVNRIFNPFFTTKEQNLGLGLAVSHRIIDAHKGLIRVMSQPDRGTTVTLTLPAGQNGGEPVNKNRGA
jgi:signal transduction histidine kinase